MAAWERFVQLFMPLLCYWARSLGLHGTDAEELVENVFAVLADKVPQLLFGPAPGFRGWLWSVTLQVFHARHGQPNGSHSSRTEGLPAQPDAEPAGGLGAKEYSQYLVQRALELLREEFQPATWNAFWQFAVAGRPADEVARDLDLSVSDVYLAKGRVLRRVRTHLAGLLD
jgi:RNA polymerase sigma-70 factor (ECF subfamily)